jgi:YD repeat-containing protein
LQSFDETVSNTTSGSIEIAGLTYTPNGKRASLTDGNSHVTSYTYDGFDRLSRTSFADSSTEGYTYDAAGNVLTVSTEEFQYAG